MKKFFMLCAAMLLTSSPAFSTQPFVDLPDDRVVEIMKKVRPDLHEAYISGTQRLGPETTEELADPLLNTAQGEEIIVRGITSVTAEWCGLDWNEKSFKPFMKELRGRGYAPKQMAFAGFLHGFGMSIMKKKYEEKPCSPQVKEKVSRFLYP